jgi:hypothetical protein
MREVVRDELEIPLKEPHRPSKAEKVDNVNLSDTQGGNSASYTLRRLKRDRPDLAERARGSGSKSV